eukprot:jgi/Ulvmu1/1338/UM011_0066.1
MKPEVVSCRVRDGTRLAVNVFPGAAGAPALVLLHANGFGARCYVQMIEHLSSHFQIYGIDARGHGESAAAGQDGRTVSKADAQNASAEAPPQPPAGFPAVPPAFPLPPTDLVDAVLSLGLRRPFVFAHSVLGTLALLAEALSPGLWAAAYIFEPVAAALPSQDEQVAVAGRMLAERARARRREWLDAAAAEASLRRRPAFAAFTDASLRAYVSGCCQATPQGSLRLRCEVEASVFETALPLAVGVRAVMHAVTCPVTFAAGDRPPGAPDEFMLDATAALASVAPRGQHSKLHGMGHFAPFCRPEAMARDVLRQLLGHSMPPQLPAAAKL